MMALKTIMVAVAIFVVVAAAQAMAEKEEVFDEENGWKMVNHLRLLDYVRDDSSSSVDQQKTNGGGDDTNVLVSMKQNIAVPRQLLDSCTNYKCHPKHTECPEGCADCPEDEEDPQGKGVDCDDL